MTKLKRKVVMLPTNEKAFLALGQILANVGETDIPNDSTVTKQHLYILGGVEDGEIKESDWFLDGITLHQCNKIYMGLYYSDYGHNKLHCKKVIATTDKSLGLPQPSESFIEAFIKSYNNGSPLVDVMIEYEDYLTEELALQGKFSNYRLKTDKQNIISITRIKDSWTREEVGQLFHDFVKAFPLHRGVQIMTSDINSWLEHNL
jgi:hypothetical protein